MITFIKRYLGAKLGERSWSGLQEPMPAPSRAIAVVAFSTLKVIFQI
jgi:hypothetical protein